MRRLISREPTDRQYPGVMLVGEQSSAARLPRLGEEHRHLFSDRALRDAQCLAGIGHVVHWRAMLGGATVARLLQKCRRARGTTHRVDNEVGIEHPLIA